MRPTTRPSPSDALQPGASGAPAPRRPVAEALVLAALALAAAVALFAATAKWPETPDGFIHLQRANALADALRAGVIFPRWFPDFAFGYGYPVLHYYAPASYYPPALLQLAGVDPLLATRLALAALLGVSAWAMVRLARRWVSLPAALAASVIFLAFTYRLYDLFVRGALPEFAAFLWLPLLAAASAALADAPDDGARRGWRLSQTTAGRFAVTALLWAGLLLTHNLTALMAAALAIVAALIWLAIEAAAGDGREALRSLLRVAAAWAVGGLIAAWYVAPALLDARWVGIGGESTSGYVNHFADWSTLFVWGSPYPYPAAADPTVPIPAVVALILLGGLILIALPKQAHLRRVTIPLLVIAIASLWLTTASSAWVWRLFEPVLGRLQFPWRWQAILAPAVALIAGLLLHAILRRRSARWNAAFASIVIVFVLFDFLGALRWTATSFGASEITTESGWAWDSTYGQVGVTWAGEFLPIWVTEQRWAIGRPPEKPAYTGMAGSSGVLRLIDAGYQDARYAIAEHDHPLTFHRFYFPTWQVTADGLAAQSAHVTSLGLQQAGPLPASAQQITLEPAAVPSIWIGRAFTGVGWLVILWLLFQGRRRTLTVTLWCATGAIALLAATGWTQVSIPSQPMHADYGAVQLAGVIAPPAYAGQSATIRPHWWVREPGPAWTVFVHVVDASGAVVAQRDEPLGSIFTPPGRLVPGEIVAVPLYVPLPQSLQPGEYSLRLGLYPAGHPDAPLLPPGSAEPWVSGTLEVRP